MRNGIEPFLPAATTERPRGRGAAFGRMSPGIASDNRSGSNKPSGFTLPPEQARSTPPASRRDGVPCISGREVGSQRPDKIPGEACPKPSAPSKGEAVEQPDPGPGPSASNPQAAAIRDTRSDPPEGGCVQACQVQEQDSDEPSAEDSSTEELGVGDPSATLAEAFGAPSSAPSPAAETPPAVVAAVSGERTNDAALAPIPMAGTSAPTGQATLLDEKAAAVIGGIEKPALVSASPAPGPTIPLSLSGTGKPETGSDGADPAGAASAPASKTAASAPRAEPGTSPGQAPPTEPIRVAEDFASSGTSKVPVVAGDAGLKPASAETAATSPAPKEEGAASANPTAERAESPRPDEVKLRLSPHPMPEPTTEPAVTSAGSATSAEISPALAPPGAGCGDNGYDGTHSGVATDRSRACCGGSPGSARRRSDRDWDPQPPRGQPLRDPPRSGGTGPHRRAARHRSGRRREGASGRRPGRDLGPASARRADAGARVRASRPETVRRGRQSLAARSAGTAFKSRARGRSADPR